MAASNNPYYIEPANAMQALMSGMQGYEGARKNAKEQQTEDAMDAAAKAIGTGDNKALMQALLQGRQIGPAIEIAKLGRQQEASRQFGSDIGSIFGQGSPSAGKSPLTALMQPPPSQPAAAPGARPPVQPSSTVWGDQEGIDAGIYPANPTQPAAPSPVGARPPVSQAPGAPSQISQSPSLGGVNLDKAVPMLLRGATNADLPKEQQETARALLLKAFDQYPQEIRQLELFKQRPDLFKMALELKQAGATSINTAEGLDAAQTKGRITMDQAAIKDLAEKVTKTGSGIPLLKHIIATSKDTPQGFAGAVSPLAAKLASTVGIPVSQGMSNAELWQSATRQLIPSVREPGATSNYENQLYMGAVPNASQSHEGRTKIADLFVRMQQRDQEIVALYRKHLGAPELSQKVAELSQKPLFSPQETQWLELQGKAAGVGQPKSSAPTNKTSTGVTWSPN